MIIYMFFLIEFSFNKIIQFGIFRDNSHNPHRFSKKTWSSLE